MQPSVEQWCRRFVVNEPLAALDIGGRNINGHVRDLWKRASWTVIDLLDGPGVTIVADAADWVPDRAYDVVVCTEVFEHSPRWADLVATAYAALRDGGRFIATCAGPGWLPHSGIDGKTLREGEHYRNVSADELHDVMRSVGFRDIEAIHVEGRGVTGNTHATAVR